MKVINHPDRFKEGIRILHLIERNKDSNQNKTHALEISRSVEEFDKKLNRLLSLGVPNTRIYASTSQRDIHKAIRLFKERQLDADYDESTWKFYNNLQARWISCLSNPKCVVKEDKLWLFDCDTPEEYIWCMGSLGPMEKYTYETKNGQHIIVKPFNMHEYSEGLNPHKNSLMLWAY